MVKMVRKCLATTSNVELKTNPRDGSYYVEGLGSEGYMVFMDIFNSVFKENNTFYYTEDPDECLHRLKCNQSDYSTTLYIYYNTSLGVKIPLVAFSSKTTFLSGYNLNENPSKPSECGTVFDNLNLLEPSVHLWAMFIRYS